MKYFAALYFISLLFLPSFLWENVQLPSKIDDSRYNQTAIKDEAFEVLKAKCNVCHATKKRTDIFTLKNMDSLAADIHKQVFVKQKMPKGRKVKLTNEEGELLEKWLSTVMNDSEPVD